MKFDTKKILLSAIISTVLIIVGIFCFNYLKQNNKLGIALPEDNYDTFLTAPAGSTDTTFFVNALPDISESIYTIYASDGTTPREKIYCTGKTTSPNRLTGCVRGIADTISGGVIDETAGTGLTHSKNSRIAITDNVNFLGKALTILAGLQKTSSTAFILGTGASSTYSYYFHNTNATSTDAFLRFSGGRVQFSEDGTNTYNLIDGGSGLSASSTGMIAINGSLIEVNSSGLTNNVLSLGAYGHALKNVYASGTVYASSTLLNDGYSNAPAYSFASEPSMGLARTSAGILDVDALTQIRFNLGGGSSFVNILSNSMAPLPNNNTDLGIYTGAWKDIYASGTVYASSFGGATGTSTINNGALVNGTLHATGNISTNGSFKTDYISTGQDSSRSGGYSISAPANAGRAVIWMECNADGGAERYYRSMTIFKNNANLPYYDLVYGFSGANTNWEKITAYFSSTSSLVTATVTDQSTVCDSVQTLTAYFFQ